MISPRTRNALWAVGVGLASLLPLALSGGLSPTRTLAWRDSALLYAPLRHPVVEALRSGRLPLWNPYEGTGQPLFAQAMHAVLHPTSLLLAPFTSNVDAWLVSLIVLGAVGAFVAARGLGVSAAAAAAASGGFALSGYVLSMLSNLPYLAGAVTMPWVVAAMHAAATPGRARPLLTTIAVAAMAFSGDFQILVAAGIIGAALAWQAGGLGGLARATAGAALGLAVAAVQLVPSWVFLGYSARSEFIRNTARFWPLDPWRLIEFVSPGFFVGRPEAFHAPVFIALGTPSESGFPWAPSIFVGAVVLLLAGGGAQSGRMGRWLAGLSLLFLWLAFGHHLGAQQLLAWVPIWGHFHFAEKLVAPLTLCLALCAALGVDAAARMPTTRVALAALLGGALAAALAIVVATAPGTIERFFGHHGADASAAILARHHLAEGMPHAVCALVAVGAALLVARWRPVPLAMVLTLLVWLEGWAAAPFALHVGSTAALGTLPTELRAAPPGPRLITPIEHPISSTPGLDTIDRSLLLTSRVGLPPTSAVEHIDNMEGYTSLLTLRAAVVLGTGQDLWTLFRRFGATHLVATPPRNAAEQEALRVASEGAVRVAGPDVDGLSIWEVPHRPWAYFATSVRAVPSFHAAAVALQGLARRGGSAPEVIVETSGTVSVAPGRVLGVRRGAEEVEVEAEADGDGTLIVNDAWDPGWRAEIDGAPARILPADVLVRAVRWPAGRHRLRMYYDPREVALGSAVSALALVTALLVLLWSRRVAARHEAKP